jgi:STAS domain
VLTVAYLSCAHYRQQDFEEKNVKLLLANWKGPQRDMLERAGFYEHVTDDTIFLTLHDAVVYAKGRSVSPRKVLEGGASKPVTVTEDGQGGTKHTWRIGYQEKNPQSAPLDGSTTV